MSDQLIEEQEKRDREFDDSGYEEKPIFHFGEIGKLAVKLNKIPKVEIPERGIADSIMNKIIWGDATHFYKDEKHN